MLRKVKHIFGQAWVCYAIAAIILMLAGNLTRAYRLRLSLLQMRGEYPIQFFLNKAPYDRDQFREAIRYYYVFTKAFPFIPDGQVMMGLCYEEIGKLDKARTYLNQAYALKKDFFWNRFNIGILKYRQHDLEEASVIFRDISTMPLEGLQIIPASSVFVNMLSDAKKKEFLRLSLAFNASVQSLARLMLLQCLWEQQKYQEAFDLTQLFLTQSIPPGQQTRFMIWSARALINAQSEQIALLYLLKMRKEFGPNNVQMGDSIDRIVRYLRESPQRIDEFFQDALPVPDEFVVHPWRETVSVGRELLIMSQAAP